MGGASPPHAMLCGLSRQVDRCMRRFGQGGRARGRTSGQETRQPDRAGAIPHARLYNSTLSSLLQFEVSPLAEVVSHPSGHAQRLLLPRQRGLVQHALHHLVHLQIERGRAAHTRFEGLGRATAQGARQPCTTLCTCTSREGGRTQGIVRWAPNHPGFRTGPQVLLIGPPVRRQRLQDPASNAGADGRCRHVEF